MCGHEQGRGSSQELTSTVQEHFIIELTDNLVFMLFFAARTPGSSACSSSGKEHMLFG